MGKKKKSSKKNGNVSSYYAANFGGTFDSKKSSKKSKDYSEKDKGPKSTLSKKEKEKAYESLVKPTKQSETIANAQANCNCLSSTDMTLAEFKNIPGWVGANLALPFIPESMEDSISICPNCFEVKLKEGETLEDSAVDEAFAVLYLALLSQKQGINNKDDVRSLNKDARTILKAFTKYKNIKIKNDQKRKKKQQQPHQQNHNLNTVI